MQPLDPIWLFIEKLEEAGFKYFVTGSIASIVYGEPRLTHDIDLVLRLETEDIAKLEVSFPLSDFYCPPEKSFASKTQDVHTGILTSFTTRLVLRPMFT